MREVARLAGIDIATYVRLEQGRYAAPSPLTLKGVARALKIPVLELFAAAGYVTPGDLIDMAEYVKTVGGNLPGEVEQQMTDLITHVIESRENFSPAEASPGD